MSGRFFAAAAATLTAVTAGPAIGIQPSVTGQGAGAVIGITGFVPVVCTARMSEATVAVAPGTVQLGNLREFCNSPTGYRVVADYSPTLSNARLLVDGKPVPLSRDGSVTVSQSNGPAIGLRQIALDLPGKAAGGTISFRMEPR